MLITIWKIYEKYNYLYCYLMMKIEKLMETK